MVTEIVWLCLISRSRRFCSSPARKPGGIIDLCFSVRDANRKHWKDAPCLVAGTVSTSVTLSLSGFSLELPAYACNSCSWRFGRVPYICACVEATPSPVRRTRHPVAFRDSSPVSVQLVNSEVECPAQFHMLSHNVESHCALGWLAWWHLSLFSHPLSLNHFITFSVSPSPT